MQSKAREPDREQEIKKNVMIINSKVVGIGAIEARHATERIIRIVRDALHSVWFGDIEHSV